MFIQTEATPNPSTLKFLPGITVLEGGSVEFIAKDDLSHAPLPGRLMSIQGVERVFLGHDFVSVTKNDDTDWSFLKSLILAALMEHFSTGQPVLLKRDSGDEKAESGEDDDEISAQIRELIETRVRPAVMMDGGDIVFHHFEGGVVYLEMRGACSGCPSASMTLKSGIENMLKHFLPEVIEVRAMEEAAG